MNIIKRLKQSKNIPKDLTKINKRVKILNERLIMKNIILSDITSTKQQLLNSYNSSDVDYLIYKLKVYRKSYKNIINKIHNLEQYLIIKNYNV